MSETVGVAQLFVHSHVTVQRGATEAAGAAVAANARVDTHDEQLA